MAKLVAKSEDEQRIFLHLGNEIPHEPDKTNVKKLQFRSIRHLRRGIIFKTRFKRFSPYFFWHSRLERVEELVRMVVSTKSSQNVYKIPYLIKGKWMGHYKCQEQLILWSLSTDNQFMKRNVSCLLCWKKYTQAEVMLGKSLHQKTMWPFPLQAAKRADEK